MSAHHKAAVIRLRPGAFRGQGDDDAARVQMAQVRLVAIDDVIALETKCERLGLVRCREHDCDATASGKHVLSYRRFLVMA